MQLLLQLQDVVDADYDDNGDHDDHEHDDGKDYLYMLGDSAIRVGQAAVNSSRPSPSCSLSLVSFSS